MHLSLEGSLAEGGRKGRFLGTHIGAFELGHVFLASSDTRMMAIGALL